MGTNFQLEGELLIIYVILIVQKKKAVRNFEERDPFAYDLNIIQCADVCIHWMIWYLISYF